MNRVISREWAPAIVLAKAKTNGVITIPPRKVLVPLTWPNVAEFDRRYP